MARKFDKYGYNRQFKGRPASKKYPFPHPIRFVDDFSPGAETHNVASQPIPKTGLSRKDIEAMWSARRAATKAFRNQHPNGALTKNWKDDKHMLEKAALGTVGALLAAPAAAALVESEILASGAAATRSMIERAGARALASSRARLMARFQKLQLAGRYKEALEAYKDWQYLGRGGVSFGKKIVRGMRKAGMRVGYDVFRGLSIKMGPV